jgi:predicted RNase H-like HicB family nuclease
LGRLSAFLDRMPLRRNGCQCALPRRYNKEYECTDEGEEQVQQFAVVVKPDPEDEGFVATIPGVPGVVGHGHTEEEALQEAKAALESLREARNSDGGRGGIPHPFDTNENLDALAAEQGVKAAPDFDALLGDFWPEDESADEFVAALRRWRRESKILPDSDT